MFFKADTRDRETLEAIFREHSIEAVIQLAALKYVPESLEKPLEYYDNNLSGDINVLEVDSILPLNFLALQQIQREKLYLLEQLDDIWTQ